MTYVECVYAVSALAATDCVTPCTATPEYYGGTTTKQRTEKEKHWVHFSISETKDSADAVCTYKKYKNTKKIANVKNDCTTIIKNCTHYEVLLYTLGTCVEMPSSLSLLLLLLLHTIFINSSLSLIPLVPRQRPWEGGAEEEEGVLWAGMGWGCPALISKKARVEGRGEQKAPEIKTNCPKTRSLFSSEEGREKGVLEWKGLVAFFVVLVTNARVRFVASES